MWYSQNDPRWQSQRLGTCNGITIGSDGCYVTAFANMANDCGRGVTPAELDDIFTNRGMYDSGCLCEDNMLSRVYADIVYQGSQNYPGAADLSQLNNDVHVKQILEIDANLATPEIDTHFMYFYDYVDGVVRVIDSWTGLLINLAAVYGDPATCIVKIVTYTYNPPAPVVQAPPPPVDPTPIIPPPHSEPTPTTTTTTTSSSSSTSSSTSTTTTLPPVPPVTPVTLGVPAQPVYPPWVQAILDWIHQIFKV